MRGDDTLGAEGESTLLGDMATLDERVPSRLSETTAQGLRHLVIVSVVLAAFASFTSGGFIVMRIAGLLPPG
jgi:hypothetical protein